jgi:hypothetical protein
MLVCVSMVVELVAITWVVWQAQKKCAKFARGVVAMVEVMLCLSHVLRGHRFVTFNQC